MERGALDRTLREEAADLEAQRHGNLPAALGRLRRTICTELHLQESELPFVAELVAGNKGLGYFILNSMRGLYTDQIFLGITVIGLLGLLTDQLFKAARDWLLPWAQDL